MTGGELRLTECKSDEAIRVNADVYWIGAQSRLADQKNDRKIIIICFEFGPGMRVSHHPEGNVSECVLIREADRVGESLIEKELP